MKNTLGHWYEYNKSVRNYNREAGIKVTLLGHKDVTSEVQRELEVVPTFHSTNWDGIYNSRFAPVRYWGILKHNLYIYKTIKKYLEANPTFDCIFVPTVVIYHWIAWAFLARKFQGKKFKRLVLFVRNNAGSYSDDSDQPIFQKHTLILKFILKSFDKLMKKGNVCIGTDSSRHAREYKILSGLDLTVFPHPIEFVSGQREKSPSENIVTISCLGPARFEKGIDVLEAAIVTFLKKYPELKVQFIIQWNNKIMNSDDSEYMFNETLKKDSRVTYITEHLTSEQYQDYLMRSDAVLLPYRRKSYYTRLSAPAIEAATLGIPVVYTKDTWIEEAIGQYGSGIGFQDGNADELAKSIKTMVTEIEKYRAMAQESANRAKDYHSKERFMECLWGL